jgi:hypothetical protein
LTIAVVDLGTDKELWGVLASVTVDFRHPALDVFEADLVQDVIHQNYAMGTTVIRAGDGAETLLPGSIPDLHLNLLAIELWIQISATATAKATMTVIPMVLARKSIPTAGSGLSGK